MAETNEQKISRMAKVLKTSCFEWLDHYKRDIIVQNTNYSDLNWWCRHGRYYYSDWDQYDPYNLDNYEKNSPEHSLVQQLLQNESSAFRDAILKTILNEWIQREENKRVNMRIERTQQRLKEARRIASACNVSIETVLLAELLDAGVK